MATNNMIRFRVVSVDHYGFLGRDYHPEDSDVGQVVVALKMHVEHHVPSGEVEEVFCEDGRVLDSGFEQVKRNINHWTLVTVWTCVTDDRRVLELLGHEIEQVPS